MKIAALLALIVLLTAAVRVPCLDYPFERDEGEYAYIAWRLGHDELPYRDWVDQKPPGIFWVYRAALALPVDPIRAVHFMALLFAAASACALFFLARRFLRDRWATLAAALFALLLADPIINGLAANTELFMLLPLILSLLAFFAALDPPSPAFWPVICGALTGIAIAFKQVGAVNWIFLLAMFPMLAPPENRWRQTFSFAAWSTVGLLAVWGIIAIYFRHGWGDLVYNVFTHNLEYVRAVSWEERVRLCFNTLRALAPAQAVAWTLAVFGIVVTGVSLVGSDRKNTLLIFLSAWIFTSAIGVSASGYFFPHYFQQLLPPLCLAAALGAEGLSRVVVAAVSRRTAGAARTLSALLALILILPPVVRIYPFLFRYTPAEALRKIYPGNSFAEMVEIGARLGQATATGDRMFIFGAEPELLFYAKRLSATRYIFLMPLYGPYADALEKQKAAADEITDARPAAAVYLPNQLFFMPGSKEQYFTSWAESYLHDNFNLDVYIAVDPSNALHLIPSSADQERALLPSGQKIIGATLLRK